MKNASVDHLLPVTAWLSVTLLAVTAFAVNSQSNAQALSSQVEISSTITGTVEQARTLYVLPWQEPVALIRLPGADLPSSAVDWQPLDRQHFLRFISTSSPASLPLSVPNTNNTEQED